MRWITIILLVALISASCDHKIKHAPETSEIIGLAYPVQLSVDSTLVYLSDYLLNWKDITKILLPVTISLKHSPTDSTITLYHDNSRLAPYEIMTLVTPKGRYDLLLKKSMKKKIELYYKPQKSAPKQVQIAGQVNNWNPKDSHFEQLPDGTWKTELWLNPGKYHYQLVINGKWILDPNNPVVEDNNIGGQNSVLIIEGSHPDSLPYIFTQKPKKQTVIVGFNKKPTVLYAFWENYLLDNSYIRWKENHLEILIPGNAAKPKRSHIRIFAANEHGSGNDLLIPLEFKNPVTKPSQLTRNDKHTQILYFLMVDRFYNGNPDNDHPLNDPEVHPKANYMGGDLVGVAKKIEDGYFSTLGINTLWLSPITQNPLDAWGLWPKPRTKFSGYHGYWPIALTKVDFRFGTEQELRRLLNSAHQAGMNMLLDYVANHVHKNHPVYQTNPDWATPLYLPDGSLNTERWDEYRLTTWFDTFLPTLDLERAEVYEPMTDSALFWLTTFDFDGYRHDATKHIPEVFWRRLTQKIKKHIPQRSIYQIGETYGSRELISSYIGSGMMDAQFDFNLYDAAVATFAKPASHFQQLNNAVQESMNYYGSLHLMGNMSGNQDKPRFISLASGDVRFDEDSKLAGWTRDIKVSDTLAYRKLQLMNAFNLTIPGVPTIYYGDEIGMPGGNDPDNRRMMKFTNLSPHEQQTFETTRQWIHLRKNLLPLQYGTFKPLLVTADTYAFLREFNGQSVLVIFNKAVQESEIHIDLPKNLALKRISEQHNLSATIEKEKLQTAIAPLSAGLVVLQ